MARGTKVDSPSQLITIGGIFGALGIAAFVIFSGDLGATRYGRGFPMWAIAGVLVLIGVIGIGTGLFRKYRSRTPD